MRYPVFPYDYYPGDRQPGAISAHTSQSRIMSTSFAAALASIVPPLGLTIDRRVNTSRAFPSPKYPRRVQSKAAASTSSDPNPTADPAEVYAVGETADDGEHIVSAAAWVVARQSSLDPDGRCGVFAMYDPSDNMLYAGYAKDAISAVRTYVEKGLGARVRVAIFANRATATRVNLRAEQDRWIGEWIDSNGGGETAIPPGNTAAGAADWTLPAEDWGEQPASSTAAAPRPKVDGDGNVVSPYAVTAAASVAAAADVKEELDPNRELAELTVENVDAALNEVRPFLAADGGDVEVVGIEDGIVAVRMFGACGTCSSSTATLKGGIEATLFKVFGREAIKEVVNLDQGGEGGKGPMSLSVEKMEEHLKKLEGAIHNYGGSVKVVEVESGVVTLAFSGPLALAQSVASSIKGKFPLVKECKITQV